MKFFFKTKTGAIIDNTTRILLLQNQIHPFHSVVYIVYTIEATVVIMLCHYISYIVYMSVYIRYYFVFSCKRYISARGHGRGRGLDTASLPPAPHVRNYVLTFTLLILIYYYRQQSKYMLSKGFIYLIICISMYVNKFIDIGILNHFSNDI